MRVSRRQFFGLGTVILGFFPWLRPAITPVQAPIRLRILTTTDIHCYLAAYDYYRDEPTDRHGLSRVASLIRAARREAPNTLLFDDGDLLEGNPLSDYMARRKGLEPGDIHPVYKAMNLLHYDAATLGNHDFNYGFQFLERAVSGANFPYVLANVFRNATETPYFKPYVILDRTLRDQTGGAVPLRIGVLGLTTPQIVIWARRQMEGVATTADICATARRYVPEMKAAGAQLIVVLAHTGLGQPTPQKGEENAGYSLTRIDGIDIVITGHVHKLFPDPSFASLPGYDAMRGSLNGRPVAMAGFYGSHLGVMDLTLAMQGGVWHVADSSVVNRPVHRSGLPPERDVEEAIADDHEATLDYVRQPVGTLAEPLDTWFALVAPNKLLSLIADVQLWAGCKAMKEEPELFRGHEDKPLLAAVAPFKAGAGRGGEDAYTVIAAGPVTLGNVADFYAYPNELEIVAVTGAGLREWLEMSATLFHRIEAGHDRPQQLIDHHFPTYNFDVIYGVTYTIDAGKPARYRKGGAMVDASARRIVNLMFEGKPVEDGQQFLVATNNFRASGGGEFPGLDGAQGVFRSPDTMQETIVAYLREFPQRSVDTRPGPWRFAPFPAEAEGEFDSSPDAANAIPAGSGIVFDGPGRDGAAKYRIQPA